jgi:hypothetical protein
VSGKRLPTARRVFRTAIYATYKAFDDDNEMTAALPAATLPPAQPVYVLRGHGAAIHTLLFFRSNTRLLTGDAEGWIVIWSVAIRRPTAVWRAHEASILGAQLWGHDKLIT